LPGFKPSNISDNLLPLLNAIQIILCLQSVDFKIPPILFSKEGDRVEGGSACHDLLRKTITGMFRLAAIGALPEMDEKKLTRDLLLNCVNGKR
jgi:hypothetical protein